MCSSSRRLQRTHITRTSMCRLVNTDNTKHLFQQTLFTSSILVQTT
jgi:hypothetical protein